jgi:hypothetical protein
MKGIDNLPAADIYVRELENLAWGYPIYCPEREVHVGDVGFFRRDTPDRSFRRLFNVLCDATDPANAEFGVPEEFIKYQDFVGKDKGHYAIYKNMHSPQELMSSTGVTRDLKFQGSMHVVL